MDAGVRRERMWAARTVVVGFAFFGIALWAMACIKIFRDGLADGRTGWHRILGPTGYTLSALFAAMIGGWLGVRCCRLFLNEREYTELMRLSPETDAT